MPKAPCPSPKLRNGGAADPRKSIMISIFEPKKAGGEAEVVLGDGYADEKDRPIAKNDDEIRKYLKEARERELKNQVIIKAEERVPARTSTGSPRSSENSIRCRCSWGSATAKAADDGAHRN